LSCTPGISAEEQLLIYDLNRGRNDPVRFGQEHPRVTVDLSDVTPRPPLAVNAALVASSGFKAAEMAANNYFAHQSEVTGQWPNAAARACGYALPDFYPSDTNNIESLAAGFPATIVNLLENLIEDDGVVPPGHRIHLFATSDFFASHREIGAGFATDLSSDFHNYLSIHTAVSDETDVFLTGVVFNDANGNERYDLNEGLGGVTVSDGTRNTTTNSAGGWSIRTAPGARTVTASGGPFSGTATAQVTAADQNIEIDFLSGLTTASINFAAPATETSRVQFGATQFQANENAGTALVTLTRTGNTTSTVQVGLQLDPGGSATPGSDFGAIPNSVTFNAGETNKSVAITILDDMLIEGNETLILRLVNPGAGADLGPQDDAMLTIVDFEPGAITGRIFEDLDLSGTLDTGEPALPGVTVYVDENFNEQLDAGERTRISRANGRYRFGNLVAGGYTICAQLPPGYDGFCVAAAVTAQATTTNVHLGAFRRATIRGTVFHDADADGVRDPEENVQVGVTLFLDLNLNGSLDGDEPSRTSNPTGQYRFRGLLPGTYFVVQVVPHGFEQFAPATPDDQFVSVLSGGRRRLQFANVPS
jgi:hypothetical protein